MKLNINLPLALSEIQIEALKKYIMYTAEGFSYLSLTQDIFIINLNKTSIQIRPTEVGFLAYEEREELRTEIRQLEGHIKNFLNDLLNNPNPVYKPSMSVGEVVACLNRTPRHVQRMCQEGTLRAVKLRNRQWRVWGYSVLALRAKKI